jgi:hypothetical protein
MICGFLNEFCWMSLSGIGPIGVSVTGFWPWNVRVAPEPLGDISGEGVNAGAGVVVASRYVLAGLDVLGVPQELQPLLVVEYVPAIGA